MRYLALGLVLLTACGTGFLAERELRPPLDREQAIVECRTLCTERAEGPQTQCLGPLDEFWVCEIAPQATPERTCPSIIDGTRDRYVLLTPDCELLHPVGALPG